MVASPGAAHRDPEGSLTVAGRTVPIDGDGNAILRFRGPSGTTYRQYSAAAVIQSELKAQAGEEPVIRDPDAFRGRHVIFGFTAPGLYDLRPTPVGGVFPGSEIHATALDNLLEGDFMSRGGAGGDARRRVPAGAAVAPSRSSSPGRRGRACSSSRSSSPCPCSSACSPIRWGWWLPLVVQEAAVSLSLLGALAVNYATEGKQKRFIKGAFRQYLSPAVIDQLIEHPERLKLGGERRTLSIFFSDLQGFTGISEGLAPEALTALLNEYLSAMTDIIQEEGGTVDKYVGDAIVAFWNAPLDQPDHAERAARSALRCQEKLAEMRPGLREQIGKDLFMRIGLNTGRRRRRQHGVAQPVRLHDPRATPSTWPRGSRGSTSSSAPTSWRRRPCRRRCPEPFPSREISRVAVVGRKEPVRVFELLSRKDIEARDKELSSFAEGLQAFTAGELPGGPGDVPFDGGDRPRRGRLREKVPGADRAPPGTVGRRLGHDREVGSRLTSPSEDRYGHGSKLLDSIFSLMDFSYGLVGKTVILSVILLFFIAVNVLIVFFNRRLSPQKVKGTILVALLGFLVLILDRWVRIPRRTRPSSGSRSTSSWWSARRIS